MRLFLNGWMQINPRNCDMKQAVAYMHERKNEFCYSAGDNKRELAKRIGDDVFRRYPHITDEWLLIWVDNDFFIHNKRQVHYYADVPNA